MPSPCRNRQDTRRQNTNKRPNVGKAEDAEPSEGTVTSYFKDMQQQLNAMKRQMASQTALMTKLEGQYTAVMKAVSPHAKKFELKLDRFEV